MTSDSNEVRLLAGNTSRAEALIELGRYREAIPLLSKSLTESPEDSNLHCMLATALFHVDEKNRALETVQHAIHLTPDNDFAHNCYARFLLDERNFDGALIHARNATRLEPDDPWNLYVLALAEYQSGHAKQALKAGEQALELMPDNAHIHQLMGDLTFNIHNAAKAEVHYREALRHAPEDAGLHFDIAQALQHQHKTNEAASHYVNAVRLDPGTLQFREKLFDFLHHEVDNLPIAAKQQIFDELGAVAQDFYKDELRRRPWADRLRTGSIVAIWLAALILMTLVMTYASGGEVGQISNLLYLVVFVYLALVVGNRILNIKKTRFLTKPKDQHNNKDY